MEVGLGSAYIPTPEDGESRLRSVSSPGYDEISETVSMETSPTTTVSPSEATLSVVRCSCTSSSMPVSLSTAAVTSLASTLSPSRGSHYRLPMRLGAVTAVHHSVPNIIVEHVSTSFADSYAAGWHSSAASQQLRHTLTPPFSSRGFASAAFSNVCRQARTLSDSSVYELEKTLYGSAAVESRTGCRAAESLDLVSVGSTCTAADTRMSSTSTAQTVSSAGVPTSCSTSSSWLTAENVPIVPAIVPIVYQLGNAPFQQPPTSPRFSGPERSPKAYWLRRHSDSNLASGQGSSVGLRVEPYPVRSHSTGDTLVISTSLSVFNPGSSSALYESTYETLQEQTLGKSTSSPYDLQGAPQPPAQKCRMQEEVAYETASAASATAPHPSTVTDSVQDKLEKRAVADDKLRDDGDSLTLTMLTDKEEMLARHKSPSSVESTSCTHSSDVHSERSDSRQGQEKESVVDKRLKLKKYLQTRYQTSLHKLHQSSDTDDVFTDRFSSPGPFVPPVRQPYELTAQDLQQSGIRSNSDRTAEFYQHSSHSGFQGPAGRVESLIRIRPRSAPWKCLPVVSSPTSWPFAEGCPSTSRTIHPEEQIMVKTEPMSPRAMPSGSSVFVFPPPPLVQHDYLSQGSPQYMRTLHSHTSPLSSPVTPSMMERCAWLPISRNVERFSGAERTFFQTRDHHRQISSFPSGSGKHSTLHTRSDSTMSSASHLMEFTSGPAVPAAESVPRSTTDTSTYAMSRSSGPSDYRPDTPVAVLLRFPKKSFSMSQTDEARRWRADSPGSSGRRPMSTSEGQSFVCPVCAVSFLSYRSLTEHMAMHVAAGPPSPAEPGKETDPSGAGSKMIHLCPVCQRTFSRGDMLTRHVRLHTGVRPYECTLCSQVFSRSDHLTTHQRTHTGEKPYRCPICAYAAPRRDMVTRHARIHESSGGASGTSGRRGRRTVSVSGPTADVSAGTRIDPLRIEPRYVVNPHRRHRSESGFAARRNWSQSVADDEPHGSAFEPRQWSLASSSESAEGSTSTPPAVPPVTCRAWSTTSAESYESYPGASAARSSVSSSVNADSPDVFSHQLRHFRWGMEGSSAEGAVHSEDSAADVTPAFQKCSVASPLVRARDSDDSDVE